MIDLPVSDRLKRIAGLITKGSIVADIGTDHGYLPIYLVKTGISPYVIAADVRKKPLQRAVDNAACCNVSDKIDFRLSDGFEKIDAGEASSIVICGMGGHAIKKILESALSQNKLLKETECVLSPHTDREALSEYLYNAGFYITDEILLHEAKAYYILWKCSYDGVRRSAEPEQNAYGRLLLNEKSNELREYLLREETLLSRVLEKLDELNTDQANKRRSEIIERLELNRSVRWF